MATIAMSIIRSAFTHLGVFNPSQPVPDNDGRVALDALNRLINTWQAQRLALPQEALYEYPLTVGKQAYTVGPASPVDFIQNRPDVAFRASIVPQVTATGTYERPIPVLSVQEWQAEPFKDLSGTFPLKVYYDRTVPNGTLYYWPTPTTSCRTRLYVPTAINTFSDVADNQDLPPAYEEALIYNLALRLALPYGRPVDPMLAKFAADSVYVLKRMNSMLEDLVIDPQLGNRTARKPWNWLSGQ